MYPYPPGAQTYGAYPPPGSTTPYGAAMSSYSMTPPPPASFGGYPPPSPYGAPGVMAPPMGYPGAPNPAAAGQVFWYSALYHTLPPAELNQLQAWFHSNDTGYPCTGRISAMPLTTLQFGGKNLEIAAAEKAARIFDKDGSRMLTFQDFACLYRFLTLVVHGFQRNDVDRDGYATLPEITRAVKELPLGCSEKSVQLYFRKFVGNAYVSAMSLPQYISMAIEMALLKSRFELADPFRKGQVAFSLDTLAQVSTEV